MVDGYYCILSTSDDGTADVSRPLIERRSIAESILIPALTSASFVCSQQIDTNTHTYSSAVRPPNICTSDGGISCVNNKKYRTK